MKVVQLQRRPTASQFSVENYFDSVSGPLSRTVNLARRVVPFQSRGFFKRLGNILFARKERGDITHVTGDIHYCTLLLPPAGTILTILDCQVLSRLTGWRRRLVKWLWFTLPSRRCHHITVISEETKRTLLREINFPAERIHVIPVCISDHFTPSAKPFHHACPRILQIGTKANKNVPRLVQALTGLQVELQIIGRADAELCRLLESSGLSYRICERLTDDEILACYREADIVAFVSTQEGFGMPIVEAQRVGRVCVTSNCSSMPEVAGEGACFVDPYDVASIRAGFLRVIEAPAYRDSLLEKGYQNQKRFEASAIAGQYAQLYRQIHEELQSASSP